MTKPEAPMPAIGKPASQAIRALLAVVAACSIAHLSPAWAGRPFTTEDAGVLEARECELESFAAYSRARSSPSERGVSVQFGCGVGANTQLAIAGARFRSEGEYESAAAFSGKTALRPLTETDVGVTLAYSVSGAKLPGERFRRDELAGALVVTVPVDKWLFHANGGVSHSKDEDKTVATYAFAAERVGDNGLDVGVEIFGRNSESPWLGTGARYAFVPDKFFVDASFAVQTNSARTRQFTVGLKYAF